ncbi:MAG: hypothetical protein PHV66_00235 [Bacteroidales bacterium]|nr:hypothetical protein [Bacteroidales bacterium]HMM18501.1 hypothetical protein [Petrimonas sp.]
MLALDKVLDNTPTEKEVMRMAELRIRNLQAFDELQQYNDSGKWRYKHPLIVHMSERFALEELRRRNPEKFLKEYANCAHNIKRYKSYLKNQNRTDKRSSDKQNLQKHKERQTIFEDIIANENN